MLLRARNDTHWYAVEVTGRFSMEAEAAQSAVHRKAALRNAIERFIEGQKKTHNSHYLGGPIKISNPLPHVEFSEDSSVDLGPKAAPDPRDREAYEAWGKAEKARAAKKAGLTVGMVDFTITTKFRRPLRKQLLTIAPSGLIVPTAALS